MINIMSTMTSAQLLIKYKSIFDERKKSSKKEADKLSDAIEELEKDVIIPILNTPSEKIESFLDQNLQLINEKITDFILKIINPETIENVIKSSTESVYNIINDIKEGKIGSAYSKDVLMKLVDLFELEAFNEIYLLSLGGKNLDLINMINIVITELKRANIGIEELVNISAKLNALMFTSFYILAENRAEHEQKLEEIASLALKYAEEKDSIITVLQIVTDKDLEKEVDEAYRKAIPKEAI
jgi:hypothetical protein